jgi:hypothetical protein
MFWTDEDIQPSVDLAEKIFGKNSQSNVFLFTREFGKIWQGSLNLSKECKNKIEMLSATINKRVYLVIEYDYKNPLYTTISKLRKVEEVHSF